MATFLSAEWLQELDDAARRSRALQALGASGSIIIEQRVERGPNGDVSYHFVIDEHGARVEAGPADRPDLTVTTDHPTAVALHSGRINAQQALSAGQLRLTGDPNEVLRRADALRELDDVFAAVRATTTLG